MVKENPYTTRVNYWANKKVELRKEREKLTNEFEDRLKIVGYTYYQKWGKVTPAPYTLRYSTTDFVKEYVRSMGDIVSRLNELEESIKNAEDTYDEVRAKYDELEYVKCGGEQK